MSMTLVLAAVKGGALFHSSSPVVPSSALKNSVPLTLTRSSALESPPALMSSTCTGVV